MTEATPAALQRFLAAEFERRGWEWDLGEGRGIVEGAVASGRVDPARLAAEVSSTYLQRAGATRAEMAAAIKRALGGFMPRAEPVAPFTLVLNDNRYQLNMARGAQITDSTVNVGGSQVVIGPGANRAEVLAGVSALVRAGFFGDWNGEAAARLAEAIDARDDITFEDVETVVIEAAAAEAEPPEGGHIRGLLGRVAEEGLGGALGTGISAALGWLLKNPPL